MKKIFLFLFILSLFIMNMELYINKDDNTKSVMYEYSDDVESDYDLYFEDENLNLGNFKLKLATFTSYHYQIKRVYFKCDNNSKEYFKNKEYFSFIGNNLNEGIDNLKEQYILIVKENNLYNDFNEITNNYIKIRRVRIYTSPVAIKKFKSKYPKVRVDKIN